jgi:2,3-bisphosphoglycerate-independent phosphoglycerate mutase
VEVVDACLARIVATVEALEARHPTGPGAVLLITADHGNADQMRDVAGDPVTAHSLNPVPIVAIGRRLRARRIHDGVLADVAPTLLELAGLPSWPDITGRSLLDPEAVAPAAAG